MEHCWCGNSHLEDYSEDYYLCRNCDTLVVKEAPEADLADVRDEGELYSRDYYLKHLPADYGFPDLPARTRNDLPERDTYWLRTLLKYRLPPASTLELGSAHGAFVALLSWAGFDAAGLELSPWLVNYARETFAVRMYQGPLEKQTIESGSLDVIILMDVLEHLTDPLSTMQRALELLKPEGLLFIQTPCYPAGVSHAELLAGQAHFLFHFRPREHLHLFSQRAARELFSRLHAPHLIFEPPIFDYDMFFLVSRQPLPFIRREQRDELLQTSPAGRLVLALLDLYDRTEMFQVAAGERLLVIDELKSAADERLRVIQELQNAADERLRTIEQLKKRE